MAITVWFMYCKHCPDAPGKVPAGSLGAKLGPFVLACSVYKTPLPWVYCNAFSENAQEINHFPTSLLMIYFHCQFFVRKKWMH